MDKDLPDLYTGHTDGNTDKGRKSLLMRSMDELNDGVSKEVGDTKFNLNRKGATILSQVGDVAVEMAVNRHLEAKAKARIPMMGGNTEFEVNRNAEGKHSFGMQSRIPLLGGNLEAQANRDVDGNRSVGIQLRKEF